MKKTKPRLYPNIIDIEASGFGAFSYPIEIGIVLSSGKSYCSLIKPQPQWTHWDHDAQMMHQLSRDTLEKHGNNVFAVANELNALLAGKTIYSDGWVVDKPWLITLFHAASIPQKFTMSALEMILSESQMNIWHDTKANILKNSHFPRHRASSDAKVIQETYARTLHQTQCSSD